MLRFQKITPHPRRRLSDVARGWLLLGPRDPAALAGRHRGGGAEPVRPAVRRSDRGRRGGRNGRRDPRQVGGDARTRPAGPPTRGEARCCRAAQAAAKAQSTRATQSPGEIPGGSRCRAARRDREEVRIAGWRQSLRSARDPARLQRRGGEERLCGDGSSLPPGYPDRPQPRGHGRQDREDLHQDQRSLRGVARSVEAGGLRGDVAPQQRASSPLPPKRRPRHPPPRRPRRIRARAPRRPHP